LKAAYISSEGGMQLVIGEVPKPIAGVNEIVVNVRAAGVTPTELLWYPTLHNSDGTMRVAAIPGHEFSGVVDSLGTDVHGFAVGDEIYGMSDWFVQGAMAEYCVTVPSMIALKPSRLSHAEAASVPIGALTAWQALFDRVKLRAGERVLVHGAAGGVGAFFVQLAKLHGAEVIATASAKDFAFLKAIKADEVVDYNSVRFEDVLSNIDVVVDGVGSDTLERSWSLLKPSGRAVTIAADSAGTADERVKSAFFIVEPHGQHLAKLNVLIQSGFLRPFVGAAVRLNQAPDAFQRKIDRTGGHGRVVVLPYE
jgi:NADPH:quinone reductase-like Zn-dependent oxidoreductase